MDCKVNKKATFIYIYQSIVTLTVSIYYLNLLYY